MIKGDAEIIKWAMALPACPCNLLSKDDVNCVASSRLLDAVVSVVRYTVPKDKDNMGDFSLTNGGGWMPSPDLYDKLAMARGINGTDMGTVEPILQSVDWNRMTLNFNDPPKIVKMCCGYNVTKIGYVIGVDGEKHMSDPYSVPYNAWERCMEEFSAEELATNEYKAGQIKTYPSGDKYIEYTYRDKQTGEQKTGKKNIKFDSRAKRQAELDKEMKFAERKADTKAREGVIRTLCGMPSGYKKEELQGWFVLYKIVRSSEALQDEHAARLAAMSRGVGDHTASAALFGPTTPEPDPEPKKNVKPEPPQPEEQHEEFEVYDSSPDLATQALQPEPTSKPLTAAFVKSALESYAKGGLIPDALKQPCENLVAWLDRTADAEKTAYWDKTVKTLDAVEQAIPEEMHIKR